MRTVFALKAAFTLLLATVAGCQSTGSLTHAPEAERPSIHILLAPAPSPLPATQVHSAACARTPELLLRLPNPPRRLSVGDELSVEVTSDRDGYLSLLVTDAEGRASVLLPNAKAPSLAVRRGQTVRIPDGLGFKMRLSAPGGTTQVTAIVTDRPVWTPADAREDPATVCEAMQDLLFDGGTQLEEPFAWTSAHLEFPVCDAANGKARPRDAARGNTSVAFVRAVPTAPRVP